uniref:Uncharacterized protein n=1 Tax=Aegilops tauschii subsp. strangulata TaxID=200361 RepID=A0A453SC69_AEGTS
QYCVAQEEEEEGHADEMDVSACPRVPVNRPCGPPFYRSAPPAPAAQPATRSLPRPHALLNTPPCPSSPVSQAVTHNTRRSPEPESS